jgi:nicotinate-nucleotide adenylyltransferase
VSLTSPPPDAGQRPRRRLGIYGGTFDPVHVGHLIIASEIRATLGLDEVLFVPASVPPHKDLTRVTPASHRLAMLRLAVANEPGFSVDTIELDRPGRSFTAETLKAIQDREPGANLWFIMGGDSLAEFRTWRTPEVIVTAARLAVAVRPGWDVDITRAAIDVPETAGRVDVMPTPLVDIASHELRDRVRDGRPIRYLVPSDVAQYITSHGLYREGV